MTNASRALIVRGVELEVVERGHGRTILWLHGEDGNPDSVYAQVKKMYDHVGGFGHLLIMGQAGFLDHEETVKGMQMFAREVYPRLMGCARARWTLTSGLAAPAYQPIDD